MTRALLGVAGATLMPSTLALMRSTITDPKERSFAIGAWSAMGAAGAAAGPLFGGVLLEYFWWGSVFLVNVPIMALVLSIGLPTLRESRDPNPGTLDLLSVVLSMVGGFGGLGDGLRIGHGSGNCVAGQRSGRMPVLRT